MVKKGDTMVTKIKISKKRLTQIVTEELKEGGMPSSVIKSKTLWNSWSDEELLQYVEGRVSDENDQWYGKSIEETLRQMAWSHGYGKMSPRYWRQYLNAKQGRPFGGNHPQVEQIIREYIEKYLKEI